MLIRFALWLFLLSVLLFLVVKLLLIFTWSVIAAFMTQMAIFSMLASFGLLFLIGFLSLFKYFLNFICDYFSVIQRENRTFLFVHHQKNRQQQLLYFQRKQINYFKEYQRKKLLEKNNREQINRLSVSITQQLQIIKHKISKELFSQLQLENQRFLMQQNVSALLELHHKILILAGE